MNVKTKYNVGSTVWLITSKSLQCQVCNIAIATEDTVYSDKIISRVATENPDKSTDVKYTLDIFGEFNEESLFLSESAATTRLNAPGNDKPNTIRTCKNCVEAKPKVLEAFLALHAKHSIEDRVYLISSKPEQCLACESMFESYPSEPILSEITAVVPLITEDSVEAFYNIETDEADGFDYLDRVDPKFLFTDYKKAVELLKKTPVLGVCPSCTRKHALLDVLAAHPNSPAAKGLISVALGFSPLCRPPSNYLDPEPVIDILHIISKDLEMKIILEQSNQGWIEVFEDLPNIDNYYLNSCGSPDRISQTLKRFKKAYERRQ